jgi:predicted Fe-S protein YdhL (DUF1289 family)
VTDDVPVCSAKGCRRTATHAVNWRNPRIHGPERRKVWTACDDHVDHLSGFLAARDFPVEVTALSVGADD